MSTLMSETERRARDSERWWSLKEQKLVAKRVQNTTLGVGEDMESNLVKGNLFKQVEGVLSLLSKALQMTHSPPFGRKTPRHR